MVFKTGRQNTFLQQYKTEKNYVKTSTNQLKAEYYHNQIVNCRRTSSTRKVIREIFPNQNKRSNTFKFDHLYEKAESNNFISGICEKTYKRFQEMWDA